MIEFKGINRFYQQHRDQIQHNFDKIMNKNNGIDSEFCRSVERKVCSITGRKHAAIVSSGTSALMVAMLGLKLSRKNIAAPNYSYVASVNQAAFQNHLKLVDVDQNGISNDYPIADAYITVSLYGNTPDYNSLLNVTTIADCSQSLGSLYRGKPDGSFGDVAIFSFSQNKPVPVFGTQGVIVWDDDNLSDPIISASKNGKLGRNSPVTGLGINAEPFELQASLADIGLDYINEWQQRRDDIHCYYKEQFKNLPVAIVEPEEYCTSNRHKFVMLLNNRDSYVNSVQDEIQVQMHYTDNFSNTWNQLDTVYPGTERFCNHAVSLPNHQWLTDVEVEKIAEKTKKFFKTG
jgi:dTDP-4-amino-4,6-dideoxygalactose transaminase